MTISETHTGDGRVSVRDFLADTELNNVRPCFKNHKEGEVYAWLLVTAQNVQGPL